VIRLDGRASLQRLRRLSALPSPPDRILREDEVRDRTGLSRTTRWRLIRTEKFPKPVKLTEHAIGWRESSIEAWLASREHGR
jgi:prophage regulatory protein